MRKIRLIGTLLVVFIGSFFVTLWLTEPGTPPNTTDDRSAAERLGGHNISNGSDLIEAAKDAGLHYSSNRMQGFVDSMSRVNDRDVNITGWFADPEGDARPLTLLIFVAGRKVAATQTRGERPDVTKAIGLAFGAEQNVAFGVSFDCRTGDRPIIVGLGPDKQYFPLSPPQCP
jgi:hypothetical protein